VWWAVPTRLRAADVPIEAVTALSAGLTIPWALKFLWAPAVDALRSRGVPLHRTIVVAQTGMAASLLPLAGVALPEGFAWLAALLAVHAFCAATQDVAIDALAVATVPAGERGSVTGWMQTGMLGGRAVFGGAALQAEVWLGAGGVIASLAGMLALSAGAVAWAARGADAPSRADAPRRFLPILREVLSRRTTWLGVTFAAVAGGGMEAAGTVTGPLLVDRGLSEAEVGRFFAVPAVVAMAGGALLGGRLCDAMERRRAAAGSLLALSVVLAALAWTARAPAWIPGLVAAYTGAYALFGVFTAASYALYMDLTDPDLGGTQFSAFMAAVNLAAVWAGFVVGRLTGAFDYPLALAVLALSSLPALALLPSLARHR
jgi:MFS family permease